MTDPCKHGSLPRSCEICERDAEIERLRAEVERLEKALNRAVKKLTRLEAARAASSLTRKNLKGGGLVINKERARRALDGEE